MSLILRTCNNNNIYVSVQFGDSIVIRSEDLQQLFNMLNYDYVTGLYSWRPIKDGIVDLSEKKKDLTTLSVNFGTVSDNPEADRIKILEKELKERIESVSYYSKQANEQARQLKESNDTIAELQAKVARLAEALTPCKFTSTESNDEGPL